MIKSTAALHLRHPQRQQYTKCKTFQFSNFLHWLVLLLRLLTCVGVHISWRQTDKHSVSPVSRVCAWIVFAYAIHECASHWNRCLQKRRIDCWRLQWNPFGAAIWWWWCHWYAGTSHENRNGKIGEKFLLHHVYSYISFVMNLKNGRRTTARVAVQSIIMTSEWLACAR